MVPRGGIEPPTLRFSVPGKGWLSSSRKIRKWLFSAIFCVLAPTRSFRNSRTFREHLRTFTQDLHARPCRRSCNVPRHLFPAAIPSRTCWATNHEPGIGQSCSPSRGDPASQAPGRAHVRFLRQATAWCARLPGRVVQSPPDPRFAHLHGAAWQPPCVWPRCRDFVPAAGPRGCGRLADPARPCGRAVSSPPEAGVSRSCLLMRPNPLRVGFVSTAALMADTRDGHG